MLNKLVDNQTTLGETYDNTQGGLPLVIAYEDNVNYLLPISDVKPFLDSFRKHGELLRVVMNTEKRVFSPPLPILAPSQSS